METPKTTGEGVFPPPSIMTTILVTIAIYNVAELTVHIFHSIRPLRSLYFWSFLISTWGICFYLLGIILHAYHLSFEGLLIATLIIFGWIPMVTGEALLLYSRLQYLVQNRVIIKFTLVMIVINDTIGHVPTVAMVYGAVSFRSLAWTLALLNYEKVQATLFFTQSVAISGLYIFYAIKMLKDETHELEASFRRILRKLVFLSVIYIGLGISIVVFEWSKSSTISSIYKATAYSIKLKLEYDVLNRLADLPSPPPPPTTSPTIDIEKQQEDDAQTLREIGNAQIVTLEKFKGKTQILDTSRFANYLNLANSNVPAGEAVRSRLNDALTISTRSGTRSAIQHWADEVSDEDDIDSFYGRSRKTNSVAGTGLTPSPGMRRVVAGA